MRCPHGAAATRLRSGVSFQVPRPALQPPFSPRNLLLQPRTCDRWFSSGPHVHPGRDFECASVGLVRQKHQIEITQEPRPQLPVEDARIQAGSDGQRTALAIHKQIALCRTYLQFDTAEFLHLHQKGAVRFRRE